MTSRCSFATTPSSTSGALRTRTGARATTWPIGPICSGAESFIAGTASCRIEVVDVDALFQELEAAGVLHPTVQGGVATTDFGTREFATVDQDGNLLTFFRREPLEEPAAAELQH